MTNGTFDLHMHSTASDGTYSPQEIINIASSSKMVAIAITDHDNVNGYFEAVSTAKEKGIELYAGVELNTDAYDTEIDILGYFKNPDDQVFLDMINNRLAGRIARAKKIVAKLNAIGMEISYDRVRDIAHGSVCRPHIIEAMVEKNYVEDQKEAFAKYLGLGQPAFVPHDHLTPEAAIQYITNAGGLPIVAHPGLVGSDEIVEKLLQAGAQGLEAYYPMHTEDEINKYIELAHKYNKIVTCGSDSHGPKRKKSFPIGSMKAPIDVLTTFKNKLQEAYSTHQGRSI
ncbi:MAG: PHP domain-containing protein [Anaerolineaceae bacterium]|nr:PHP domain-containing protein [Anaerolineaceae bacterium]